MTTTAASVARLDFDAGCSDSNIFPPQGVAAAALILSGFCADASSCTLIKAMLQRSHFWLTRPALSYCCRPRLKGGSRDPGETGRLQPETGRDGRGFVRTY